MGFKYFSDPKPGETPTPPNPNPKNFEIKAVSVAKKKREICVVEVHYPGCTTFEGNKILVYECKLSAFAIGPSVLDPHFYEKSSLIARFPANDKGLMDALAYADWKSNQE